jgi:glutamine cyclotransferase
MSLARALLLVAACLPALAWPAQHYSARVTGKKPQSRDTFVQGLEIRDGDLYVSTGLYGKSKLLRYHFADGALESARPLEPDFFAEGLTVLGDKVFQLTWRNRAMLVYRKSDLHYETSLPLPGEGWGLTNNGVALIYSDGSATLRFLSPDSGQILHTVLVTRDGQPVRFLNELEWIDGAIWANVWRQDQIVIIAPDSGEVTGVVDLNGLLPRGEYRRDTDVLNGIAQNPKDGSVWVTGKRWPWLYQIELVPATGAGAAQQDPPVSR